ncbi:MAG TPA: TolC family protein [Balneolales bacterium]|nr:TolC family protein [Balneolales bacterium]
MKRLLLLCLVLALSSEIVNGQSRPLSWFLQQAYNHDPQIATSQRNEKIARIGKQINHAMFRKPVLSGDGLALWAPGTSTWGFSKSITNGGEYDALLNVRYPLWQGNNLKAYDMVSTAREKRANSNVLFRKHDLRMQVTNAYIQIYGDQQNISYLNGLHKLLREQLNQLNSLVQGGLIKITDLKQISLEDSQIQIQIKSAINQLSQDQVSLNQLCGLPDTTGYQVNEPLISPNIKPDSLVNTNSSRFLRSFSIDSLGLSAQQKVQDTQYLPQLNALVNAGLSSASLRNADHSLGFTAGLQLSWKLWDGGQKSLQHQQTELDLENVRDQKSFEKIRIYQQRNSLQKTLQALRDQIDQQEQQVNGYRNLLDTYRTEIDKGIRPVTDYVTVFRQYLNSKNTLNTLQIQRLQTINELNYWNW